MNGMMVLFLGGPWHNQRHDVTPGRLASAARSLPTYFTVPLLADEYDGQPGPAAGAATADAAAAVDQAMAALRVPRPREHVTYTRRFARANGERRPVYVSPEYQGPARA
jgi:hypothetical protein